ncbi:Rieske (2Fe-2S) protein [Streptomyces sp. NBC_01723]|uniref:Rieske (2Fe-2S) protein n=1 Tax=Streptomyces sp. NBC_01723 TaxID=2975921 RepID=UPI002E315855|nr:Rieske (2Fe-2S) protein [Streptomyces sp. NBC_01723]
MTNAQHPAEHVTHNPQRCLARRRMLSGLGTAITVALAACSPGGGAEESAPADGSSPQDGDARGEGEVLIATSRVPVGGGVVAGGVVIAQPSTGTFRAYEAACPHQGVMVAPPEDGAIVCPAHRSTFSETDGSLISGPSPRGLTEVPVRVFGGNVIRA